MFGQGSDEWFVSFCNGFMDPDPKKLSFSLVTSWNMFDFWVLFVYWCIPTSHCPIYNFCTSRNFLTPRLVSLDPTDSRIRTCQGFMKDSNNDPEAREQVYQSPGWSKHLAGALRKITAEGFLDVIHMSSKKTRFYDRCLIHFLKIAMVIRCFFLVWSSPQVYKKSTRILDRCSTFGHMLHDFARHNFGLCCIFLLLLWFSNSWCVCFFWAGLSCHGVRREGLQNHWLSDRFCQFLQCFWDVWL